MICLCDLQPLSRCKSSYANRTFVELEVATLGPRVSNPLQNHVGYISHSKATLFSWFSIHNGRLHTHKQPVNKAPTAITTRKIKLAHHGGVSILHDAKERLGGTTTVPRITKGELITCKATKNSCGLLQSIHHSSYTEQEFHGILTNNLIRLVCARETGQSPIRTCTAARPAFHPPNERPPDLPPSQFLQTPKA